jgi:hypothetical protein
MATGTTPMYKVVQIATGVAGAPYYITGYFDQTAGTAQQAADAWRAFLAPASTGYRTGLVFSAQTEVGIVDPVSGDLTGLDTVTVASMSMIGGTDPLPAATSLLIRWRTGAYVAGKEIRGRTNIPGMLESLSTSGLPDSTLVSAWQTRQTALIGAANAQHVVWSKKNGLWANSTAGSPWSQWAVLRSRRD